MLLHEIKLQDKSIAKPFLKWVGGKRQLIEQINNNLPIELDNGLIDKYIEPFVGGGAVLFSLLQTYSFKEAYIIDSNKNLINTYRCIKESPNSLINILSQLERDFHSLESENRKSFYYAIRRDFNSIEENDLSNIKKAAYFIFLNKTCFNGLYRVNKSGEFNVPIGNYKNPNICDSKNLITVSELLQRVTILTGNYDKCLEYADSKTFIYFDPPYRPLNTTSTFTSYTTAGFNDDEQICLSNLFYSLDKKGAKLILSNSDPKNTNQNDNFFDDLYKEYRIKRVYANRSINSNAKARGAITELLITNY